MRALHGMLFSLAVVLGAAVSGSLEYACLALPLILLHCDTMDGPVIKEARRALDSSDITLILKWVRPEDEKEVRDIFKMALAVRGLSDEGSRLADRMFFETLVRVHRAGEGAPYTGLKPEGTGIGHAEKAADEALEKGSVDELAGHMSAKLADEIKARFRRTMDAKAHAEESVEKGREFVEAYVQYVHFVDGMHEMISGHGGGHLHHG